MFAEMSVRESQATTVEICESAMTSATRMHATRLAIVIVIQNDLALQMEQSLQLARSGRHIVSLNLQYKRNVQCLEVIHGAQRDTECLSKLLLLWIVKLK